MGSTASKYCKPPLHVYGGIYGVPSQTLLTCAVTRNGGKAHPLLRTLALLAGSELTPLVQFYPTSF